MTHTIYQLSALADAIFNNFTPSFSESEYTPSYPKTNIYTNDKKDVVIQSAVPGFTKDDIKVTIEGNRLKISGKQPGNMDEDARYYYSRQLAQRDFENEYTLSPRLDYEKTEVTHKDGLLTVVIPMKEEEKPKRIEITVK